ELSPPNNNGDTTTTETLQDSIKPSLSVSHSSNTAGWNNTASVTLTVTASDAGSGLAGAPSCTDNTTTSLTLVAGVSGTWTTSVFAETTHAGNCSVSDNTTNRETASDTVKVDTTAPVISDSGPTTLPNGAGWYNHNVDNGFEASDSLSGLAAS